MKITIMMTVMISMTIVIRVVTIIMEMMTVIMMIMTIIALIIMINILPIDEKTMNKHGKDCYFLCTHFIQ